MKGVILAGGTGSRLMPLTQNVNKHLLPIYDRQMICYPIESLVEAGITDIMIVCGKEHCGDFIELLGDGTSYGVNIVYGVQEKAGGICEAMLVAESFVGDDKCCVILGDNIFEDSIKLWRDSFESECNIPYPEGYPFEFPPPSKCHVVCKEVNEPQHYGVLYDETFGCDLKIVEKPVNPTSNLAVTGCYFYTADCFNLIKRLERSPRGELEVSDLNQRYANSGDLSYSTTNGKWWDTGISIDHLLDVSNEVREMKNVK